MTIYEPRMTSPFIHIIPCRYEDSPLPMKKSVEADPREGCLSVHPRLYNLPPPPSLRSFLLLLLCHPRRVTPASLTQHTYHLFLFNCTYPLFLYQYTYLASLPHILTHYSYTNILLQHHYHLFSTNILTLTYLLNVIIPLFLPQYH